MRGVVTGLAGLVLLAACGHRQDGRPSVILVMIDTLRADYLGSYGFDGEVSPMLDHLASESVRFDACISQAPWTKPAVASLFTSMYPRTHGVLTHDGMFAEPSAELSSGSANGQSRPRETDVLPEAAETLAEAFRSAGYTTLARVTNPWIRTEHGFGQGFQNFLPSMPGQTPLRATLDFAASWSREQGGGAPFFLYLHLMNVHGPYESPEVDFEAVKDAPGLGPSRSLTARDRRRLPEYLELPAWTSEPEANDLKTWRARYAAGVREVDRELTRFFARLDEIGLLHRAVLVVTSDHGEELLDHGRWDHGDSLHEHQLRVPLLLHLPGAAHAGRVVSEPVELIDLAPTLLSLAGIPVPASFAGRDLLSVLETPGNGGRAAVSSAVKWKPDEVSLRTGAHRLIVSQEGEPRLYDLRVDPDEQHDLAGAEPALLAELMKALVARLEEIESRPPLVGERAVLTDELQRKLESLGYH